MTWMILPLLMMNIPAVSDNAPNRQPQMAARDGEIALVFGSGNSVMLAQSRDGGETFSKPIAIASVPALALGRHRGPRVLYAGKTMVVSAVGGTKVATGEHAHGLPADGDLLVWRSADGGRTWSKASRANDEAGSAREGLHAMASDAQGHLFAVWLDLRAKGTRLYGAFSNDSGATWSKNQLVYESVDGTICQCCHPSIAATANGEFAVMFRNALAGNRDMYSLRVREGSVGHAEKLGEESWTLQACPMDGGAIAWDGKALVTAWRRGTDIYLADGGKPEIKLGVGADAAMTLVKGAPVAVWSHSGGVESWRAGTATQLSASGAFPSIVTLGDGALAAWEDGGQIHVARLR